MRPSPSVEPPRWANAVLETARQTAVELFRKERIEEPLEAYLRAFDETCQVFAELFELTAGLTRLRDTALSVLTDKSLLEAFRYLAGPPISLDDLKTLAHTQSLSPKRLRNDPDLAERVAQTVCTVLDRRRFPWVAEERTPSDAEKNAAALASAALLATSRVETWRRTAVKEAQEQSVKDALAAVGFKEVKTRQVRTLADAPDAGQFCGECLFGTRKADVVVGLWDGRKMPIECKVSNSATNSIKRFRNDVAAKANEWYREFGKLQIVPAAVLSGVYNLPHLEAAQERGLTIFWAHDLTRLAGWIENTSPPPETPRDTPAAARRR